MVTNGNGTSDILLTGEMAKVYEGQLISINTTAYNNRCGTFGANLFIKLYIDGVLFATSNEAYIFKYTRMGNQLYDYEYGAKIVNFKIELWWDSGTLYLEDERSFSIQVVKLSVTDWSPSSLIVEKGKTGASTWLISFKNGGNDYMYNTKISITDSSGLEITPQFQTLQDIASGGIKSTSFSVIAPSTATIGTKSISFKIEYNDFRGNSHSITITASITVGKLSTSIIVSLQPSSIKKGSSVTISAKLVDSNNNPLSNKDINFIIGTTSISSATTDSSGNAVKTYTVNLDVGTYVVVASFSESTNYGSSSATSNLIVNAFDTTLTISASSVKVGATATIITILKDENENRLSDAKIDFYLFENNAWLRINSATTNVVGQASITHIFNMAGDYQIKTVYEGSTNYNKVNAIATLTISQFNTTLIIDVPPATQGKLITIKATLKDENENSIQNANIDFQLNDGSLWSSIGSDITDSSGVASINYTPSKTGTYQVKAVFSGTSNYSQSLSTTNSLIVNMDYTPYYIFGGLIAIIIAVVYIVYRRKKKTTPTASK
jgi:hypothetical protein